MSEPGASVAEAARRLAEACEQLPQTHRIALGLAFRALGNSLISAAPTLTSKQQQLLDLARLEHQHRELPVNERARVVGDRLGLSRATYFRRLAALEKSGLSLKSLNSSPSA